MRVETLEAYDVPTDILAIWRETIGPELLPVQQRAVKEFGLFGDSNLIVFSPTSSGKTFIGEMAAVRAARNNAKVFYAVPQKALAEEKFHELRDRYRKVGIRVVVSSRDHREFDEAIERREFEIAVVVFEKLQALLVSRPQLMEAVGLVVVDEMQLITDEQRGPTLELLLTKLKLAGSKPRIVGLSAVLGKANLLADWLGAKLLVDTRRPMELRKGVLCNGTFTYREHNSGAEGTEEFVDTGNENREDQILDVTEQLVQRGEQVLAFLPDRMTTVTLARRCAARLALAPLEPALEELRDQEETQARDALREVLAGAVAFHNSDLSPEERSLVERHFRSGSIRALFSTSTLAMGMNFPVKNVILDGKRWEYLKRYDRWSREDISKSEYENMSGRAGRFGHSRDFGRSLLVTNSPFQAKAWIRHYVESDFADVEPTLARAPLENHVIDLLASGMARSADELRQLLLSSFTGVVHWAQKMSSDELEDTLTRALRICVDGGLARMNGAGVLVPTDLGQACARKGIGVETTIDLARWARESRSAAISPLEILTVASLTAAGSEVYINMAKEDRSRGDYRGELVRRADAAGLADRPVFERLVVDQSSLEFETVKAFKKALLLNDWIDEVKTSEIERRYRVWAGAVRRIGEEYAWLVDAASAIVAALGWSEPRRTEVAALADQVMFGVRTDAVPVARLRVPGLGRALARRVVDAGIPDEPALRATDREVLRKIVNHRGAYAALCAKLDEGKAPPPQAPYLEDREPEVLLRVADSSPAVASLSPAVVKSSPPAPAPTLVVDLREHRVTYRGRDIPTRPPNNLQRQPLLALAVLASRPGEVVTMAKLAQGMFELGGLQRKPVAPDARDLRYKMLRAFRRALDGKVPAKEIDRLVESLPPGMRLNVAGRVVVISPDDVAAE